MRFWVKQRLLLVPGPLAGPAAPRADTPWDEAAYVPALLTARAGEAEDALDLLFAMVSATTPAAGLDNFRAAGIAIEVMHRSKRRLFGLAVSRRRAPSCAHPAGPEPAARPAATRPSGRHGRQPGVAAIAGPAHAGQAACIRLWRP